MRATQSRHKAVETDPRAPVPPVVSSWEPAQVRSDPPRPPSSRVTSPPEVPTAQHRAPTHDAAGEEPGPFRDWKQRRGAGSGMGKGLGPSLLQ